MSYTNESIVTAAMAGKNAATPSGNMSTYRRVGMTGNLPARLTNILRARQSTGHIGQTIYSYGTPIAWMDTGVWVVPRVKYSITTSVKHQSELYRLPNRVTVLADTGAEEYARVLEGLMHYTDKGTAPGWA